MTEPLLPKQQKTSSFCTKTTYGALGMIVLTGIALYSIGHNDNKSASLVAPVIREVAGEVNVNELSSMKQEWSYYNDVTLKLEKLSPYQLEGKLLQSGYETSFQVSYVEKKMSLSRKNILSGVVEESLYSEKSKALKEEAAVYQFTDKQETVTDAFDAFKKYMASELLADTYLISLKLAQTGLTGQSAPVIKGFHSIAHTLAKQRDQSKRFTTEMAALVTEINAKIFEEKKKPKHESLLWFEGKNYGLLDAKFRYGPCDRYSNCTCEIEDRSSTCGNSCYGMCGPNCNCWAFICGDCDCHCFCYNHDYYCSCVSRLDYHCWNVCCLFFSPCFYFFIHVENFFCVFCLGLVMSHFILIPLVQKKANRNSFEDEKTCLTKQGKRTGLNVAGNIFSLCQFQKKRLQKNLLKKNCKHTPLYGFACSFSFNIAKYVPE
ncbi:hypothetical protein RFI_21788 [Reticulomyxa filosa]|uniref:Uncharacterized protein n=1 Tax=Reticulomyxa filosa TaxID=46433 RepID=X6MPH0_RETFI|nr:hypothetical protein RFI_21788 [Reticulomyxa filosa]|eukprot:ETO15576.1 hypothetical protein RFI_21788 [Reticulomyxa filosa]